MAFAPTWITPAGSLGVVPEGRFYRIFLEAEDPDFPGDPSKVSFSLIAGALPSGVQIDPTGAIQGIPVAAVDFKGVPAEVSENTTSKFVIRVTDDEDRIVDRTFTLTISGQDKPEFITPSGNIGTWFDGTELSFQFQVIDTDPLDLISVSYVSGEFPPGIVLSTSGKLSGFIDPISLSTEYEFTLQVTDGKDVALKTFNIFVFSHIAMTADNTLITADNDNITSDISSTYSPIITNNVPNLGIYRHDNYFAHKFIGKDLNSDQIEYFIVDLTTVDSDVITADASTTVDLSMLPEDLKLDPVTGWLSGYLSVAALSTQTYNFGIKVRKVIDPSTVSILYSTSMTIIGDIESDVTWITDPDLGVINNGEVSTFSVEATHATQTLFYRLQSGSDSKLPQGLVLVTSGNIIGQVSFKTFSLDGGTTTFDADFITRLEDKPTTFDSTYTFTVEAYSLPEPSLVLDTRIFTILVNREYNSPFNILYCKAMPPLADREDILNPLLTDPAVIPPEHVYRIDDPNFGSATRIIYQHAFGLAPKTIEEYFAALNINHYNKRLVLGEIKTARALDENDNVIYEVVYSQIVDDLVNNDGKSIPPEITLPPSQYPYYDDGVPTNTVYPNSLENMREQVIDQIGQVSKVLPTWMLSKQDNGDVLGFTAAWVIAYTIPGKSKLIQYLIDQSFGTQLNLIDFEIDRY